MGSLLGIDAGGTGTRALWTDEHGRELGRGLGGPGHPLEVGWVGLAKAAREAAAGAGVAGPLDGIVIGVAGVMSAPEGRDAENALVRTGLAVAGRVQAVSDVRIAHAGAFGGGPGVVVVAGTGSIAFGRNRAGEEARAAGLGPLFDDPGSAYDLGRRGLISAARAQDGRGPATALRERLLDELGADDLRTVARLAMAGELNRREIAALAPCVLKAAFEGEREARNILAWCTDELAEAVRAVVEGLGADEPLSLACMGGLLHSGTYAEALKAALQRRLPQSLQSTPISGAVEGAAQLARQAFGK